jgi:penicillin G amidase
VPADGRVVTANERRGPESDLVGAEFAAPHRARRIHALLDGRTGLTADDMAAIHGDALLGTVPALTALVPGAFDDFDGVMAAGSAPAARFAAWRSALVRLVAAQPVFDGLREPAPEHRHSPVFAPWLDLAYTVAQSLPALAAHGTPFGLDLAGLAREALAEVDGQLGDGGHPLTWGDTHVASPLHVFTTVGRTAPPLPAPPLSGDANCVCATASYPAIADACSRGPVARYVWDLADVRAGGWVVPTGAHGDPASPHHHDQLAAWADATLVPIETDWERLTPEAAPVTG